MKARDLDKIRKRTYLCIKRIQDIVLSAFALVILSPLLLLIALAVVLDDPRGGTCILSDPLWPGRRGVSTL